MFSLLMRLVGRLSVGRKLILIYALDLTAVIFVSSILINEKFIAIDFARKEIVGGHYIAAVRAGLFATLPGGAGGRAVGDALRAAEERYGKGMDSRALAEQFITLLDAPDAPARRQAIQAGQALITRIGNQSNLILDPDLDSYYTMSLIVLRFPELFELIERIRRQSAVHGDRHRLQTEYLILEGQLDAVVKGIDADFAEAGAAGKPPFRNAMTTAHERLRAAIDAYRDSAHRLVVERAHGVVAADLEAASGMLLQRLEETWTGSGEALQQLLEARLDSLFQRMWVHLGTAVGSSRVDLQACKLEYSIVSPK